MALHLHRALLQNNNDFTILTYICRLLWPPCDQVSIWISPVVPKLILDQSLDLVCWQIVPWCLSTNIDVWSVASSFAYVSNETPHCSCFTLTQPAPGILIGRSSLTTHDGCSWWGFRSDSLMTSWSPSPFHTICSGFGIQTYPRASPNPRFILQTKPLTQHTEHYQPSPMVYHKHYSYPSVSLLALATSDYLVTSH